jgi:predicted secreted protein
VLSLNGLQFRLSDPAMKKLDSRRIEAAYRNLGERIDAIAHAMGRDPADALIETVDFEGSGAYANDNGRQMETVQVSGMRKALQQTEEPNFEPGETTLHMRVVGKVRFR